MERTDRRARQPRTAQVRVRFAGAPAWLLAALLPCAFVCSTSWAGTVLHVDDDASSGGDGASWSSAYRHLADALAAAQPGSGVSEIRIGQGVYTPDRDEASPDGTGDRAATFALIDGVTIAGGYAGVGAPDPDARDVAAYASILSGDLLGDDESGGDDGENSHHVATGSGTIETAILDGVTLTRGNTDGSSAAAGGGLYILDGSPLVRDCTISRNSAPTVTGSGAGVSSQYGSPRFEGCVFEQNAATTSSTTSAGGGALYCFGGEATLLSCRFTGNSATRGGAVYAAGDVTLDDCVFEGNAATFGGGIFRHELSSLSNRLSVIRSRFEGNFATFRGGAIHLESGDDTPLVMNSTFLANRAVGTGNGGAVRGGPSGLIMGSCVVAGNTAGGHGGGIVINGGTVRLFNCTITSNFAALRGGGVYVGAADDAPRLGNCIVWMNASGAGGRGESGQIDRVSVVVPLPVATHCIVQGLTGALGGVGNLDAEPQFAAPNGDDGDGETYGDNDYRLAAGSPAIDAGHDWSVRADSTDLDDDDDRRECAPLDLDGAPRFADDPAARDTGCGPVFLVDIGAFERDGAFAARIIPGDVTGNGVVDFADLLELLFFWGDRGDCAIADFDLDGTVDIADLLRLLFNWS